MHVGDSGKAKVKNSQPTTTVGLCPPLPL